MKKGIKRPFHVYLSHVIGILAVSYLSTKITYEGIGRWVLWIPTGFYAWSLIYITFKKNYIEVLNHQLIINKDYFRTTKIDLEKIEKIDLSPHPFSASKIILKDKSVIKFSDSQTKEKELKAFMSQFNIPVT